MPKNPHPPRAGGGPKKKTASQAEIDDTSFIVFGSEKGPPRKEKNNDAHEKASEARGKGKAGEGAAYDVPKKPSTREIVGGASWTGKLPVNMLSEHCQKQKWDKPEYTMVSAQNYAD